ncbi:MAG: hypothetical protein HY909_27640 [Deltaproteobacteria bacterium]|nr:hypothetical protein [Deltaproteobacteria bacterium]
MSALSPEARSLLSHARAAGRMPDHERERLREALSSRLFGAAAAGGAALATSATAQAAGTAGTAAGTTAAGASGGGLSVALKVAAKPLVSAATAKLLGALVVAGAVTAGGVRAREVWVSHTHPGVTAQHAPARGGHARRPSPWEGRAPREASAGLPVGEPSPTVAQGPGTPVEAPVVVPAVVPTIIPTGTPPPGPATPAVLRVRRHPEVVAEAAIAHAMATVRRVPRAPPRPATAPPVGTPTAPRPAAAAPPSGRGAIAPPRAPWDTAPNPAAEEAARRAVEDAMRVLRNRPAR